MEINEISISNESQIEKHTQVEKHTLLWRAADDGPSLHAAHSAPAILEYITSRCVQHRSASAVNAFPISFSPIDGHVTS